MIFSKLFRIGILIIFFCSMFSTVSASSLNPVYPEPVNISVNQSTIHHGGSLIIKKNQTVNISSKPVKKKTLIHYIVGALHKKTYLVRDRSFIFPYFQIESYTPDCSRRVYYVIQPSLVPICGFPFTIHRIVFPPGVNMEHSDEC